MQPRQRRLTSPTVVWNLDCNFLDGARKNNGDVWVIAETTPGFSTNRGETLGYDPPPPRLRRAGLAQPDQDGFTTQASGA